MNNQIKLGLAAMGVATLTAVTVAIMSNPIELEQDHPLVKIGATFDPAIAIPTASIIGGLIIPVRLMLGE
jgi:hypothetical protein